MKRQYYGQYYVPVRVSGTFCAKVCAETPYDAYQQANELTENANFGALSEIDWDIGEPEPFDAALHNVSEGGDATLTPDEQLKAQIAEMISLARRAWEIGDQIAGKNDNDQLFEILTQIQEISLTDVNEAFVAIKEALEEAENE